MIVFSETGTIILYLNVIALSIIFAYLAQKYGKKGVQKFFWTLSFLCLWIPCAFRASGVDHTSYYSSFSLIQTHGKSFFNSYSGSPEPLFAALEYLIVITVNRFQCLYIIASFIALLFTFMGFAKMYKRTSLPVSILWFSATYYMIFYGLVRMSIAIGIMTYAYHFIEKRKLVKYFVYCTIATLFHYSAVFMFLIYFILKDKKSHVRSKKSNKERLIGSHPFTNKSLISGQISKVKQARTTKKLAINIIYLGLAFYAVYKLFPIIFSGFSWYSRYRHYFNANATMRVFNNLAGFYLLFIFLLLWQKKVRLNMINGDRYVTSAWAMFAVGLFSIFFPITRLAYYLMPMGCYIYGFIPRIAERQVRMIFYIFYLVLGIAWWYYAFMTPGLWGDHLVPYQMNLQF